MTKRQVSGKEKARRNKQSQAQWDKDNPCLKDAFDKLGGWAPISGTRSTGVVGMNPVRITFDDYASINPNNCSTCDHKAHPGNGWCYMWRTEPIDVCRQHTCRKLYTGMIVLDKLS